MNCKYCFLKKAFRYGACRGDFNSFKKIQIEQPTDENQNQNRTMIIDDVECLALSTNRKRGNEGNDSPSPKHARLTDNSDDESLALEPGPNSEKSDNNSIIQENPVDDEIIFSDEETTDNMIIIDETTCRVCNKSEATFSKGVMICRACYTFFKRRCDGERLLRPFEQQEICPIDHRVKLCQFCRMKKCLESGLRITSQAADENMPEDYSSTEIGFILKSAVRLKKNVRLSSIYSTKKYTKGAKSSQQVAFEAEPDVELDFSDEDENEVETAEKITIIKDPDQVCRVCSSVAEKLSCYEVCHACQVFFSRVKLREYQISECQYNSRCKIVSRKRSCYYCRLKKCLDIGMLFNEPKTRNYGQERYTSDDINSILEIAIEDKSNTDLSVLFSNQASTNDGASIAKPEEFKTSTSPVKNIDSSEDCESVPVFSEATRSTDSSPVISSSQEIPSIEPVIHASPVNSPGQQSVPEFEIESCTITELNFSDEEVVEEEVVIGDTVSTTTSTYQRNISPTTEDLRPETQNQLVMYSSPCRFNSVDEQRITVDTDVDEVVESSETEPPDILSEEAATVQTESLEIAILSPESVTVCTTVALIEDQPDETVAYITDGLVCHVCSRVYNMNRYCNICPACNTFSTYIRDNKTQLQSCPHDGNCSLHFSEKMCRYCRMKKCLEAGMRVSGFTPFTKTYTRQDYTEDEIRAYLDEKTKGVSPESGALQRFRPRVQNPPDLPRSESKVDEKFCEVCNKAGASTKLGAVVCFACYVFFTNIKSRRSQELKSCDKNCEIRQAIVQFSQANCRYCRFKKCLEVGMRVSVVRTNLRQMYTSDEIQRILAEVQKQSDIELTTVLDSVRLDTSTVATVCNVCNRPGTNQTVCCPCRLFANKLLAANQEIPACEVASICSLDYKTDIKQSKYYCQFCRFKRVLDLTTGKTHSSNDLLSILTNEGITKVGDLFQTFSEEKESPKRIIESPSPESENSDETEVLDPAVDFHRKRLATAADMAEKSELYMVSFSTVIGPVFCFF